MLFYGLHLCCSEDNDHHVQKIHFKNIHTEWPKIKKAYSFYSGHMKNELLYNSGQTFKLLIIGTCGSNGWCGTSHVYAVSSYI